MKAKLLLAGLMAFAMNAGATGTEAGAPAEPTKTPAAEGTAKAEPTKAAKKTPGKKAAKKADKAAPGMTETK